jgi:glucose-6-phosphate 1-epimerase
MQVERTLHPSGVPLLTVRAGENAFELSPFGAQLLSWTKGGVPILFANREAAIVDGRTAYRGGAPICFPYFGKGLLLPNGTLVEPQHGRARTSLWDLEVRESDETLVFRTEQPSADGYGPTAFRCELAYRFADDVDIRATITNAGGQAAPFQFVVHSYWATPTPADAAVTGLGPRYLDNLAGYAERVDEAPDRPHLPPFDRVYPDAADRLEVATDATRVAIATSGCSGAVLWNPGGNHGIKDLHSPDFVCVESGLITPAPVLAPGETRTLEIAYRARLAP